MKEKIIRISIIILSLTGLFLIKIIENKKIKSYEEKTSKIIEENFPTTTKTTTTKTTSTKKEHLSNQEDIKIKEDYLGILNIERLKIKKPIKKGTSNKILNQNIIGLVDNGNTLESTKGQIILAGHNNPYTLKNITTIKTNDKIKIITKNNAYTYKVTNKKIIKKDNLTIFNKLKEEKELVIITCLDDTRRLLIFAK